VASNLQQLSNIGTDADTRVSNAEELVDETSGGDKDDTNKPSTECAGGNCGVVVVVDDSTHFGVGRILPQGHKKIHDNPTRDTHNDDQGSFDLELLINPLILGRVVPQRFIILVAACGIENARREVGVLSVLLTQPPVSALSNVTALGIGVPRAKYGRSRPRSPLGS